MEGNDRERKEYVTEYSQSIFDEICDIIATSNNGLVKILKSKPSYPSPNIFYKWIDSTKENIEQYARAREAQADFLVDEILEIADDSTNDTITIQTGDYEKQIENKEWTKRSELKVNTRKWIASKFRPSKYGDKLDISHEVNDNRKEVSALFPLDNDGAHNQS
jgi:hypothetical protein